MSARDWKEVRLPEQAGEIPPSPPVPVKLQPMPDDAKLLAMAYGFCTCGLPPHREGQHPECNTVVLDDMRLRFKDGFGRMVDRKYTLRITRGDR